MERFPRLGPQSRFRPARRLIPPLVPTATPEEPEEEAPEAGLRFKLRARTVKGVTTLPPAA